MKPLRTLLAIYVLFLLIVIITYKDANAIELSKYYKEPLTETDKKGIIAFNMLQTIDMLQTLEIANNDDYYEKNKILEFAVKQINKRVKIVVGIGGNNTNSVVKEIKSYNFDSIDGILSVSPAYNKPSQQGIYAHYEKISENSPVDIIIYNVPSRTGSNISAKTTLKLANNTFNCVFVLITN